MDKEFSEVRADLDQAPEIWFVHVENPEYTTFELYYLGKSKNFPGYKVPSASQLQTGRRASRSGIGADAIKPSILEINIPKLLYHLKRERKHRFWTVCVEKDNIFIHSSGGDFFNVGDGVTFVLAE